mgnify:CR=1 FL=1
MIVEEPTIRELRKMVHLASKANPLLTSRLEKAAFLVLLRTITSEGRQVQHVGSEDGLRSYQVRNGHCECSDYVRHGPGHPCKHRLAVALGLMLDCSGPPSEFQRLLSTGAIL